MATRIRGRQIAEAIAGSGIIFVDDTLNVGVDNSTIRVNFEDNLEVISSGILQSFIWLTDTPTSYSGEANKYLAVNSDETGIIFTTVSGGSGFDHSLLSNLDYENSGHIGFASSTQLSTTSGDIVSQIPTDYISDIEMTSISGDIITYVDNSISGAFNNSYQLENKSTSCNGSTVDFVLNFYPIANSLQVYLNGLLQEKGEGKDYTNVDTTVSFITAPLTNDILIIHYMRVL